MRFNAVIYSRKTLAADSDQSGTTCIMCVYNHSHVVLHTLGLLGLTMYFSRCRESRLKNNSSSYVMHKSHVFECPRLMSINMVISPLLTCHGRRRHLRTRSINLTRRINIEQRHDQHAHILQNHGHRTCSIQTVIRSSYTRATRYQHSRPCAERVTPCGPKLTSVKQWCVVRSEAASPALRRCCGTHVDTSSILASEQAMVPKGPRELTKTLARVL